MTSIISVLLVGLIWILFKVESKFKYLGVGNTFSFLIVFFITIVGITVLTLAPEKINLIAGLIGKDTTFTGRTELWQKIIDETGRHLFLGCGFGAYWVMDNINLLTLYDDYNWLPRQAHMGYLDILNETGVVGITLLFLMIISYFKNLFVSGRQHFWKYIFFAVLIINFQESTIFRERVITGTLFIFAYLALQIDIIKVEHK